MTKKEYVLIARAFNRLTFTNTTNEPNKARWVINELCNILKYDNPKFNIDKFRKACGLYDNTKTDRWYSACGCMVGYSHISRCINSDFSKKHS